MVVAHGQLEAGRAAEGAAVEAQALRWGGGQFAAQIAHKACHARQLRRAARLAFGLLGHTPQSQPPLLLVVVPGMLVLAQLWRLATAWGVMRGALWVLVGPTLTLSPCELLGRRWVRKLGSLKLFLGLMVVIALKLMHVHPPCLARFCNTNTESQQAGMWLVETKRRVYRYLYISARLLTIA